MWFVGKPKKTMIPIIIVSAENTLYGYSKTRKRRDCDRIRIKVTCAWYTQRYPSWLGYTENEIRQYTCQSTHNHWCTQVSRTLNFLVVQQVCIYFNCSSVPVYPLWVLPGLWKMGIPASVTRAAWFIVWWRMSPSSAETSRYVKALTDWGHGQSQGRLQMGLGFGLSLRRG